MIDYIYKKATRKVVGVLLGVHEQLTPQVQKVFSQYCSIIDLWGVSFEDWTLVIHNKVVHIKAYYYRLVNLGDHDATEIESIEFPAYCLWENDWQDKVRGQFQQSADNIVQGKVILVELAAPLNQLLSRIFILRVIAAYRSYYYFRKPISETSLIYLCELVHTHYSRIGIDIPTNRDAWLRGLQWMVFTELIICNTYGHSKQRFYTLGPKGIELLDTYRSFAEEFEPLLTRALRLYSKVDFREEEIYLLKLVREQALVWDGVDIFGLLKAVQKFAVGTYPEPQIIDKVVKLQNAHFLSL